MTLAAWLATASRFLFRRARPDRCSGTRRGSLGLEHLERRELLANYAVPLYVLNQQAGQPAYSASPVGDTVAQIRQAYGINSIVYNGLVGDGTGQTIAIIDAYDDPAFVNSTSPNFVNSDLHKFDVAMGLPDPPSFRKVAQDGSTNYPAADKGWSGEIALDVEWAHALAPQANILLVEATDNSYVNLISHAVNYARNQPGVSVVTMSFGGDEFQGERAFDGYFTTPAGHSGVTFVASSGDSGTPGGYPALSPNVVAVGGTTLFLGSGGNYGGESTWSGSGGGLGSLESQPVYQSGVVTQSTTQRAIPDVAFDADPRSGVAVYDSVNNGSAAPWWQVGGTSFSAPAWAALISIADQIRVANGLSTLDGPSQTLPSLYQLPATDFHDVASGNNGTYSASPGYDLVTGRGSPIANLLVPDLAGIPKKPSATIGALVDQTGAPGQGAAVLHSANGGAGIGTDVVTIPINNPNQSVLTIKSATVVTDGAVIEARYGLYAVNGYHQALFGLNADWLFSNTSNLVNDGLYFLTTDGTLYAWNGNSTAGNAAADGTVVAYLDPAYYADPAPLLAQAAVQPGTPSLALAQQLGLSSLNGYHQSLFGLNADWFFSTNGSNGANGGLYFLTPDGNLYAWNGGSITGIVGADGLLVGSVAPVLYSYPDNLATAGLADPAYQQLTSLGLYTDGNYRTTLLGLNAKWLFSNNGSNAANSGLYFLDSSGNLYAWNGNYTVGNLKADGTLVAALNQSYYSNPMLLLGAQPPLPGPRGVAQGGTISLTVTQPTGTSNPNSTGSITISGYQGLVGSFGVQVTVNDGVADSTKSFEVKVVDPHTPTLTFGSLSALSVLTTIATATTPRSTASVTGSYTVADSDSNETLSYQAKVVTAEHAVDQVLGLFAQNGYHKALLGLNADWFFSNTSNLGTNGPNQGLYFLTADGSLFAYDNGSATGDGNSNSAATAAAVAADGTLVAKLSPNDYLNPVLLATGSAADAAYNAQTTQGLGLFESGGNFHSNLFGINAMWLVSKTGNQSNDGLYFISPDGALHQWDGGNNAATAMTSPVVAQLNPSYYYDPTLLINATTAPAQPPAGVTAVASGASTPGGTVSVTASGYGNFVGTFGVETTVKDLGSDRSSTVDFLVTTTNSAPTFTVTGASALLVSAGTATISLQATDSDVGDALTYSALVFSDQLSALAWTTQQQINAFAINGYHQGLLGLGAKWLFSNTSNLGTNGPNQGLYFITADGKLYAYNNGSATGDGSSSSAQTQAAVAADGTLVATLDPSFYADPTKLTNAPAGNTTVGISQSGAGGKVLTLSNLPASGSKLYVAASVSDGYQKVYKVIQIALS